MYLSLPMMTNSMVLKHRVLFSICTILFEHITSSHRHLYSILLTLLYILPLLTQLGCVCLPTFWLFCCLCIFVIWFSRCCWCSFVLQEQYVFPSIPTYHFWRTKKFEGNISTDWIPRVPSSKCKKHYKQFVRLARCKRVMTTQAEFHFSWVYAFSATLGSLQIWATHPLK